MSSDDVTSAVERLIDALRAHATLMARGDGDPPQVMAVVTPVRSAARAYVDAVFEATGWGSVFADLYEDEDEHDDEDDGEDDGPGSSADALRLSLAGRWDFVVEDPEAWTAYARRRLTEAQPDADPEEIAAHIEHPAAALLELFALDGWDTERYSGNGAEPGGSGWQVEQVERTLFEMDPQDRDEAGF